MTFLDTIKGDTELATFFDVVNGFAYTATHSGGTFPVIADHGGENENDPRIVYAQARRSDVVAYGVASGDTVTIQGNAYKLKEIIPPLYTSGNEQPGSDGTVTLTLTLLEAGA